MHSATGLPATAAATSRLIGQLDPRPFGQIEHPRDAPQALGDLAEACLRLPHRRARSR